MKHIIIVLITFCFSLQTKACDICGCGIGSSYIGILPEFHNHIFGIRYRHNSLLTHLGTDGMSTYLTTRETYKTLELWGGWNIGKKIRLLSSIPYSFNERDNQGNHNEKNGLGDISVSGFYQLINSRKLAGASKLFAQNLWLGAGIKLPTGKYNPTDKSDNTENANLFQLGTGSTDFTVNLMYDARIQDIGINVFGSYKINTTNKYDYSYGNKFNVSAQGYYKYSLTKKITIAPNAGILYEKAKKDIDNAFSVDASGGNVLLGTAGLETTYGKIAIGGSWQSPLSQKLANGIVKANNRVMIHVSFLL